MKWAFEYAPMDAPNTWQQTRRRFKSMQEACIAAGEWMEVCETNGYRVATRLCNVE